RRVRENEHRQTAGRLVAAERPQHLEARELRHEHVEQHDVRPLAPRQAQPFLPFRGGRHRQPALTKARLPRPPPEPRPPHPQPPFPPRLHGSPPLTGSVKLNVDPRPSSDSHQTWPSSRSTI